MNKYEQQIAALHEEMNIEQAQYANIAANVHNIATEYCNQYNSITCIINVERHLMRKEIRKLYRFLKNFGDIGDPITPFDFVAEDWLSVQNSAGVSSAQSESNRIHANNYVDISTISAMTSAAAAGSVVMGGSTLFTGVTGASIASSAVTGLATPMLLPVAVPAVMLIKEWQKRSTDKDKLADLHQKAKHNEIRHQELINQAKNEVVFLANAVKLADLYRNIVVMVRDAIEETILPELDGIMSFLYADAIKNCIINNEDPNAAVIGKISEYRATAYDNHYQFVRNTFDYYRTITAFFTSKVMGNLLQKREISKSDFQTFSSEVNKLEAKQRQLCASTVFGGQSK